MSEADSPRQVPNSHEELDPDWDSEDFFLEAMSGVKPIEHRKTVKRQNGLRDKTSLRDERQEGLGLLNEFVNGVSEFNWAFHPDYQEGGPEARNGPLLRKLRRGGFSVQAELDLHGMTQSEALEALDAFLHDCSCRNIRCVRIVHGKGRNSINNIGVLKRKIPKWLSTHRFSRKIIAFTSARPEDGGVGATYVLLRRRPRSRGQ